MKQGLFITLEGGEGVGKTSNVLFIQQLLEQAGKRVVTTREPGGTVGAEKIRQLLLDKSDEKLTDVSELLLMFAARAQHIEEVIKPALAQGSWVLCDRFTDATYAYQGGGRGMDNTVIAWLEQTVQGDLKPNLTLLLDAPIKIGMARANKRGELDRFESEKMAFFARVRACYLQRAEDEPLRIKPIDARQSLDQVQQAIIVEINHLIDTV